MQMLELHNLQSNLLIDDSRLHYDAILRIMHEGLKNFVKKQTKPDDTCLEESYSVVAQGLKAFNIDALTIHMHCLNREYLLDDYPLEAAMLRFN